ncbi:MAG: polyprenol monophosphomannose synthase [Phycisphaerae bacterium]
MAGRTTRIIDTMPTPRPAAASIIVPTFHEAPNIRPLAERVFAAAAQAGRTVELILVDDDSRDGIDEAARALATKHPVRLIVRRGERGLSGAVLAGFAEARYDRLVVLDADLQHPPELIPTLLDRLDKGDADFVVATRYGPGGGVTAGWPWWRRLASRTATLLARPLAPLSDPMSGFFALRRETWRRADHLNPIGYKIGLELYVKAGCHRPAEVPIRFDTRRAGHSKLTLAEQVRYLRHLYRLYRFKYPYRTLLALLAAALATVGAMSWIAWIR